MSGMDDKDLGMGCPIARRNFISGVAVAATAAALPDIALGATSPASDTTPAEAEAFPPLKTGLRGQYDGAYEQAHAARDGHYKGNVEATDANEQYDLIVVGAGISGLSSAYFYHKALAGKKVLVLDNLDDFGGHAKRNEFRHNGKTVLANGGTMLISTPFPYSFVAKSMLTDLGIEPSTYKKYQRNEIYKGLTNGIFFDKENFGKDQLVSGFGSRDWTAFFADAPLSPAARDNLIKLYTDKTNHLPGMTPAERAAYLKTISYQDYLVKHAGLAPENLRFFKGSYWRNNMRVDTCPAFVASRNPSSPGFAGMEIQAEPIFASETFHFPDGNASIARLMVSKLVPDCFGGPKTPDTIVMAPANYAALDRPGNSTRIRLSSIVVRVEHIGKPDNGTEKAVRVVYATKDGKRVAVTGANVILACYGMLIPFITPELPAAQKAALRYNVKVPMQYTSVFVKNWLAWKKLGIRSILAPNGYHPAVSLEMPVAIGGYETSPDPTQPILVHMARSPAKTGSGLSRKDQHRAGRADMLATPYEKIELEVRSQLQRMLGAGGFDAKNDILGITVNRWPHGYTYTYDSLEDHDMQEADKPYVIGRAPYGRIAMAGSDMTGAAYTNVAIDQANRAVQEVLISRGLT